MEKEIKLEKQLKLDKAYLKMALIWSELSYCEKAKVGSIIVKNDMIISDGYNGTVSKIQDNCCEDNDGKTQWYVLHSEANAILKCAKYGQSCNEATLYQTMSPCKECSKLILQSGIKRVVYIEQYRDLIGINLLLEAGVIVEQIKI